MDDIKTVSLKPVFTIYSDDDGLYYAVRNFSPKFCLSAKGMREAAEAGAGAMTAYEKLKEREQ